MRAFCYLGETANIGRFGQLRKGDRILLTDAEENGAKDDKRFELWDDAKHGKLLKGPALPPDASAEDRKKAQAEEEARRANVEKANDEWTVMKTELDQSSYEALVNLIKRMNEEDKVDIRPTPKTTKRELIRLIVEARKRLAERKEKE